VKIAIVHPSLDVKGGAENIVVWLAWGLRQRGHDVRVLTARFNPSLWQEHLVRDLHVVVIKDSFPRLNSKWLRLRSVARELARHIADFDLVNPHNWPANLWTARAIRSRGTRPRLAWYCEEPNRKLHWEKTNRYLLDYVAAHSQPDTNPHLHRDVELDRRAATKSWRRIRKRARDIRWDKSAASAMDLALVNSTFSQRIFQAVYGYRPTLCHLGIPIPPPEEAQRPKENHILTVSPLSRKKNVHNVVEAMAILVHRWKIPDIRLEIIGDGPEREAIANLIEQRQLADRVQMLGFVSDAELHEAYRRARIVVYTPVDEPFGLVPIEAMARGTPVVASNHGGPLDSVVGGETGIHVDPFDPEAIAQGVRTLWCDEALCSQMGKKGRQRVASYFSLDQFLTRFERAIGAADEGRD